MASSPAGSVGEPEPSPAAGRFRKGASVALLALLAVAVVGVGATLAARLLDSPGDDGRSDARAAAARRDEHPKALAGLSERSELLRQERGPSAAGEKTSPQGARPAGSELSPPGVIAPGARRFRFVVWPDTHIENGGEIDGPVKRTIELVTDEIKPAFVIHTGDMIGIKQVPGGASGTKVEAMWSLFESNVTKRLVEAGILFFPTPGNHDVYKAFQRYQAHWAGHENRGVRVRGPRGYSGYYSFDYGKTHFVSLQAPGTRWLSRSTEQIEWLRRDLEEASRRGAENVFVFSHSPIYCPELDTRCNRDMLWLREPELLDLLREHDAVHLGGHMHVFNDTIYEGVRTLISGMLGGGRRALARRQARQPYQFLVIDVDGPTWMLYRVRYPGMDISSLPEPARPGGPGGDAAANVKTRHTAR